jgi:hypothetical protein
VYGLSVVAVSAGTLLGTFAPSGADQVSDLQARAAQISHQIILEQLQVGGYEQQYQAAEVQVEQERALVSSERSRVAADQQRIAHDESVMGRDAVLAYMDDGSTTGTTAPLFGGQQVSADRDEYAGVVTGDLSVAVDLARTDRQELEAAEGAFRTAVAQDQAATVTAGNLLAHANGTEQALQSEQAQVSGQLATAVAQEKSQEESAASQAVSAAEARAAAQAAAASASEAVVGAPNDLPTGGPALTGFLQCVVEHESGGDYQVVSSTGQYMGAFQFSQSTWNEAAQLAGMSNLVGVPPNAASPADQDALAVALYAADGSQPWYDPCTS